jgi:streptomycin 6-kinase
VSRRWSLTVGEAIDNDERSAAWVAPVTCADSTQAVLKVGFPHYEARDEAAGLRFWDGDPTVRLLDADEGLHALLLERCVPGTHLRQLPEEEQDVVIASLLRRLWRPVEPGHRFRPLSDLAAGWEAVPEPTATEVLLATDLHAGNVLRAEREEWLVIDPKPFVGDPAYDVTQHVINCKRPRDDVMARMAALLDLDLDRVRGWMEARALAGFF